MNRTYSKTHGAGRKATSDLVRTTLRHKVKTKPRRERSSVRGALDSFDEWKEDTKDA